MHVQNTYFPFFFFFKRVVSPPRRKIVQRDVFPPVWRCWLWSIFFFSSFEVAVSLSWFPTPLAVIIWAVARTSTILGNLDEEYVNLEDTTLLLPQGMCECSLFCTCPGNSYIPALIHKLSLCIWEMYLITFWFPCSSLKSETLIFLILEFLVASGTW